VPAFLPFWLAGLAGWWWFEIRRQLGAAPGGVAWLGLGGAASLALGARLLATLSEAGVYCLWWRGRGARLPYWRFVAWVGSLSTTDLLRFSLRRAVETSGDLARAFAAALAGPATFEPARSADSGLAMAFGDLGLLTLLRIFMTAWAQAEGTGRPVRGAIAVTLAAWLITRLAAAWSFDLARGLSPVG
jgi:hypothetical protein